MVHTSFEGALAEVDTVYRLVILAAKRSKQLDNGSPPLVKTDSKKSTLIALEEIAAGKVKYDIIEEEEEGLLKDSS